MIEKKHHFPSLQSPSTELQGPSSQQEVRKARVLFTLASLARAAKVTLFQRSEGVFSGDLSEQL